jgi:hypothetical protein
MGTKAKRTDFPDGTWKIGTEDAYLIFLPADTKRNKKEGLKLGCQVLLWKNGEARLAEQKSLTKGFKVFDDEGNVNPLVFELLRFDSVTKPIVEHLRNILAHPNDLLVERAVDEFASALKATRKLMVSNREASNLHQRFDEAVVHLARRLVRPPTKHEIGEFLCIDKHQTSKLCKENRFDWLLNERPGRKS